MDLLSQFHQHHITTPPNSVPERTPTFITKIQNFIKHSKYYVELSTPIDCKQYCL